MTAECLTTCSSRMLIHQLLADLSIKRAELANTLDTDIASIEIKPDALVIGGRKIEFTVLDLSCYQTTLDLLVQLYNYYPNILGDSLFKLFDSRTNKYLQAESHGGDQVLIRQWKSTRNKSEMYATLFSCRKFRMLTLEVDGESMVGVNLARQSWEYFSCKTHCSSLGLFPYIADTFSQGKIEDNKVSKPMAQLFDNCLPSWYSLVR